MVEPLAVGGEELGVGGCGVERLEQLEDDAAEEAEGDAELEGAGTAAHEGSLEP